MVLHGRETLDEGGLGDITDVAFLRGGEVSFGEINPQDLGLTVAPLTALRGGNVEENATILTNVLQGKGTQAQQDAVALNAAFLLRVPTTPPPVPKFWRLLLPCAVFGASLLLPLTTTRF